MQELDINSLISDLALILILGAISTVVFKMLKQPLVLGYIVAGFIASPNFSLFPTIVNDSNIEFWAQLGIIVLLFSLGLEFSFKKLINAGASAVMTALIIVLGMMSLGYLVGKFLGFGLVDSIFLGGMISMSSTTIIIKALTDLNMRQRRFVPMTFAVLIIEDLFAVVMMVILSSIAIHKTVDSTEMLKSILILAFFLIIWFTVGIYVLPTLLRRFRHYINNEQLLIISMGLCFLMVIFAIKVGFSAALGAFVMGSILAGTIEAERIERIITPVKDLFGAVFFISVGMMVDPSVIAQYWSTILLLSAVVIVGMIVFGTFGMLATGQPLKLAMESGFTLTQIGEFSFIIATLGTSMNVLDKSIYPIIVAVSVITTFTTPFFIKQAVPCYNRLEKILPKQWTRLLNGYSKSASQGEADTTKALWGSVIKRTLLRMVIYTVISVAMVILCDRFFHPFLERVLGTGTWGKFITAAISLALVMPFIFGLLVPRIKQSEINRLVDQSGKITYVPIVVMMLLGIIIATILIISMLSGVYSSVASIFSALGIVLISWFVFTPLLHRRLNQLEKHFISNVNQRENRRTGRENALVSDLHLAYITVGAGCPFVGERLRNAHLRDKYGINLVNIQRNGVIHPVPSGEMRIFPGDVLGIIGNDEQIQEVLPLIETAEPTDNSGSGEAEFTHFALSEGSPLVGKKLSNARLREDYGALLVAVQRGDDEDDVISPTPDLEFEVGDVLWVAGDPSTIGKLKSVRK